MEHKKICPVYFIDLDSNGTTCQLCKNNPAYVEQILIPAKVRYLERQRMIRKYGVDPDSPCEHRTEEWQEEKLCCGGRVEETTMIDCALYGRQFEREYCNTCNRTQKFFVAPCDRNRMSGGGIGDSLIGLWAIEGLKKKYPNREIVYYTPYPEWCEKAHASVDHISKAPEDFLNLDRDYGEKLSSMSNFIDYVCEVAQVKPEKPEFEMDFERLEQGDYVLIFPFAAYHTRTWPTNFYKHLELKIIDMSYKVILAGSHDHGEQLSGFDHRSTYFYGSSYQTVFSLMKHASLVICNDSMPAHLAGIIGTPTIAIHAQLTPTALYKYYPNVNSVFPHEQECSGCHWQGNRGCRRPCDEYCYALGSISPETVAKEAEKILLEKECFAV